MQYYQKNDYISNHFFIVPKTLFSDKYSNISANAKIIYIHMLDRCKLSMKNKWVDEAQKIFIIYPIEQLAILMNLKKSKIYMLLNELETAQLIKRQRSGGTHPNRIYVANIDAQISDIIKKSNEQKGNVQGIECTNTKEKRGNDIHVSGYQNTDFHQNGCPVKPGNRNDIHNYGYQNVDSEIYDIHKSGGQEEKVAKKDYKTGIDIHKCGHLNAENGKNIDETSQIEIDIHKYGDQDQIDVHGCGNLMSTDVDPSNNNINNNKDIDACARVKKPSVSPEQNVLESVKHQIGYSTLVLQHPEDRDAIDAIVSVMTDVAAAGRLATNETRLIGEQSVPVKEIADKYTSITIYDINNVLKAAKGKPIKNYYKYFMVCLYRVRELDVSYKNKCDQKPEVRQQAFTNFKGRDLTKTIAALELIQTYPRHKATVFG